MTTQHFKSVFWSQKQLEKSVPDFQAGFSVLHQKLGQSKVENEEMIGFFKERIAIEELYAQKLGDQGRQSLRSAGFGRDEGAGLLKCFSKLKETSQVIGEQHKRTAFTISEEVLMPLQDFHEEYKRVIGNSRQAMDSMLKQFDGLIKETEKAKTNYHRKCRDADKVKESTSKAIGEEGTEEEGQKKGEQKEEEEEKKKQAAPETASPLPELATSVQLGNQVMPRSELDTLIRQMRREITLRDYKVPILGTYKNTSTGEDIAIWLQQNLPQCKDSPVMSDLVGQQLIHPYNMLRLVGQRGNKFVASPSSYYQWRVSEEELASAHSDAGYSALGGLINNTTVPDDPYKRARREAERYEQTYRLSVLKLDQMRMAIEEAMFAHLKEMEQVELHRIERLKKFISAFIAALSSSIPQDKRAVEEMMIFHESLKPDQDIQFIIQQYAVAGFSPKAIMYENYYHGISQDQVFGVPLEDLGKQEHSKVPKFVSCLLSTVENQVDQVEDKEVKQKLWSTPCALDRVHSACLELNVQANSVDMELFKGYDAGLLVAVLRYFLLELPECLMTYEFYDPVDALLGGSYGDQDETLRLTSFGNLIATLPAAHFATLQVIFNHIKSFIKTTSAPSDIVDQICQTMGPVILKNRNDTFSTLNSRVPFKFCQALICNYDDIFSETTFKLHAESEKRRHAKPIVAQTEEKAQTKRSSLMMSFMRPGTAEGGWSNMMGVFQRNTSPTSPVENTVARTVPLSFASTITQHESPPSSPTLSPKKKEAEIMFDGDDIFDADTLLEEKDQHQKDDTQPKKPSQARIDSSFFDDDEEDENQ
ncbi:Rho-GTPase-activating protein 8 [Choanephora cucurbitarum]|uniref:Rho-GTPase-activating protein 8 n=1 Tax=Choanephora cucurbitarum TaxID=101091 RepID=A0A1C7N936_9FUNG|nr:Rho-GTPase-activating protein 8 [Choanephora cucurbitarum]